MWKPFSNNEITAVLSVILFIIGAMAVGVILFPPKPDPKLCDYFGEPIAMADLERMLELVYNMDNGLPGRGAKGKRAWEERNAAALVEAETYIPQAFPRVANEVELWRTRHTTYLTTS